MFIAVLSYFTIINKVVISLLLYFKKNNSLPNKLLASMVLMPAFTVTTNYLLYLNYYQFYYFLFINQILVQCLAIAIYFYCMLMMGYKLRFDWKLFRYFPTMLIPIGCWIYYELTSIPADAAAMIHKVYIIPSESPLVVEILNYGGTLSVLLFTLLSIYKIREHNKKVRHIYSEYEKIKIQWLNKFITLLVLLDLVLLASDIFFSALLMEMIVVPVIGNIFYFYIVYQSFSNSVMFTTAEFSDFQKRLEILNVRDEQAEKYSRSSLSEIQINELATHLEELMKKEKLYLNSVLTLPDLSNRLNISVNKLSEVINRHFNQNFFDFINCYRVEHAKKCLIDSKYDNITIEAVAEECGFGSKAAFNRAFKKYTSTTPRQYKKENAALSN